jgi:dipeptidyl aminopeptidase/acylaminoacyl peptidase
MAPDEAWRQVTGPPVADGRARTGDGYAFYQHCRQHGLWPRAVTGWDPHLERERFLPFMPIANVAPGHPPTLLIHGTEDTDVPYERSVEMAAALREAGVEHRLLTVEGGEHGLDEVAEETKEEVFAEAEGFLRSHLHATGERGPRA